MLTERFCSFLSGFSPLFGAFGGCADAASRFFSRGRAPKKTALLLFRSVRYTGEKTKLPRCTGAEGGEISMYQRPNLFHAVKAAVTTRQLAELYGLRPDRRGMVCCPFHGDKHPSMKVDARFHCFACGADGDVIDFAARLHGLNKWDAARRIAAELNLSVASGDSSPEGGALGKEGKLPPQTHAQTPPPCQKLPLRGSCRADARLRGSPPSCTPSNNTSPKCAKTRPNMPPKAPPSRSTPSSARRCTPKPGRSSCWQSFPA